MNLRGEPVFLNKISGRSFAIVQPLASASGENELGLGIIMCEFLPCFEKDHHALPKDEPPYEKNEQRVLWKPQLTPKPRSFHARYTKKLLDVHSVGNMKELFLFHLC